MLSFSRYYTRNMTIRKKVTLSLVMFFMFLFLILYILFYGGMQTMLNERENDNIVIQIHLAEDTLRASQHYLPGITSRWAAWENTYEFVRGNFDEFIEYNLNEYPYRVYDIDFITLLDLDGNVVYENFYAHRYAAIDLSDTYQRLGPLTVATSEAPDGEKPKQYGMSGFLQDDDQVIYISSHPILNADLSGPCVGSLLFGRIIDEYELDYLKNNPEITFFIKNRLDIALSDEQNAVLEEGGVLTIVNQDDKLTAYKQSYDIYGENKLLLSVSSPRYLHQQGAELTASILVIIALCCVVILLSIIKFMGIIIVKPFALLADEVNRIDFESVHALPAIKHGQAEFRLLTEAINKMLSRIKADRDAIAERNDKLYYNANYDALSGLRNWFSSSGVLNNEIAAAQDNLSLVGVFFIDLDRFKHINNSLGHRTGDKFIISVAHRVEEILGQDAAVGRIYGDKFIVIVGGMNEKHEIHLYADKIMSLFEAPFIVSDRERQITASVGSSTFPEDAVDADTLLKYAEIAMYHAKQLGGNLYCRYETELQKVLQRKLYIENKIRSVINGGCEQFQAFFQPKALSETGEIVSCEALIRWITPEGIIGPNEFIPLAEESGLILPLSRWMLKDACRCNKLFEAQGIHNTVSVNISAQVLLHKDFIDMVKEAAAEYDLEFCRLDIEITEATLIHDMVKTNSVLEALHDLGVTISIDDFGTGYSSLSYLKKLSVDRIKIDRSFIIGISDNEEDRTIVDAIVAMAKSLHMIVTAEGVETAEQYDYLRRIRCEEIQGYYVSRPIPYDAYVDFYKQWHARNDAR